ncbi:hypothetical protein BGW37DRAFT_431169 [Umbelopsis sp. PMI_123]|nr:hypothetical protein BGW37DRAFT_431169 [Umbelopsis sp. PMI_123]
MSTLFSIFERNNNNNNTAVIIPSSAPTPTHLTFNQLLQAIDDFSGKLAAVLPASTFKPGNVISLAFPNSLEFTIAFLATGYLRLTSAPLNASYTEDEFKFYLDDSQSHAIIVPKGSTKSNSPVVRAAKAFGVAVVEIEWANNQIHVDLTLPGKDKSLGGFNPRNVRPQPGDVALLLHTSGTTGRPKGVPLTHLNIATTMQNIINTYSLTPADRTYLVMPLFHVHGLICGLLATLLSGGSAVIPQKFSATIFWKEFIDNKCNWYTAVPTMHQILLLHPPKEIPNIRFIRSCSSSLAPPTFHALEKTFNAPVLEAYAMTEASHQMTSNPLPPAAHKPGSVGLGQGVEVAILDSNGKPVEEGEVCIKGANVTKGYLNNPTANATAFTADGWFRTGDQGKKDKDGYLILTGRIKELIIRGGENISPLEIDGVLLAFPKAAEAICFGVADEMLGQEVHAAVVLKKQYENEDPKKIEKELQEFAAAKLVKFKIPKRVYVVKEMQKTATGKVSRVKMSEAANKMNSTPKAKL